MNQNRTAFLTMIARSEGTNDLGDRGYNVIVGGTLFSNYADHPRVMVFLPKLGIKSSAAGRYQILAKNYDFYKLRLGLTDFSPDAQDAMALNFADERHALADIDAGDIDTAIEKCSNVWASLPDNHYHQRQNKISVLETFFTDAGGILKEPEATA